MTSIPQKSLRRFVACLFGCATLLAMPAVQALPITATVVGTHAGGNVNVRILNSTVGYESGKTAWGGQIELSVNSSAFNPDFMPSASSRVIAYCLEPQENIAFSTYEMETAELDQAGTSMGGIGITRSRQIQDLLYHIQPAFGIGVLSNAQALAVQITLWEIVSEIDPNLPYSLSSGNALFTTTGSAVTDEALTLSQGWLDAYVNDGQRGPYEPRLLSLNKTNVQDLLVQRVPAPASIALLLIGLTAIRRRLTTNVMRT